MRLVLRMLLVVAIISVTSVGARAEESSHYFPGAASSFIDTLPVDLGTETIGVANESFYYHGSNNHLIPGGGTNATTFTNAWAFLYQFPGALSLLPGKPQYSVALAVPYTWIQVHSPFRNPKGAGVLAKDTDNGFGDVAMFPFMLGWLSGFIPFRQVAVMMCGIYLVGIVALVWAPETKGEPLPE